MSDLTENQRGQIIGRHPHIEIFQKDYLEQ